MLQQRVPCWLSSRLAPLARAGPERLDLGDMLYAPNAFTDAAGRVLMLAWLQELRGSASSCGFDYAGCLSLPRVLTLQGALRLSACAPGGVRHQVVWLTGLARGAWHPSASGLAGVSAAGADTTFVEDSVQGQSHGLGPGGCLGASRAQPSCTHNYPPGLHS